MCFILINVVNQYRYKLSVIVANYVIHNFKYITVDSISQLCYRCVNYFVIVTEQYLYFYQKSSESGETAIIRCKNCENFINERF